MPPLAATVSILAADVPKATTELAAELNKALRFGKTLAADKLYMTRVAEDVNDLFLCFSDAAFATRSDMSSQGGYLIAIAHKDVLNGDLKEYNVVSWRSFKLNRVCRSSLAAEAQARAHAVDELMLIKTMISLMIDPGQEPKDSSTAKWMGASAVVVDAKALYDALCRKSFNSQQDKRTAIEILCTQQEIERIGTTLRWVSSERMIADGLTKVATRMQLAELLRTRRISLVYDPDFKAAKKKSQSERDRSTAETFGNKAYGSRAARQIANVLALSSLDVVNGQPLSGFNYVMDFGDYGILAFNTTCRSWPCWLQSRLSSMSLCRCWRWSRVEDAGQVRELLERLTTQSKPIRTNVRHSICSWKKTIGVYARCGGGKESQIKIFEENLTKFINILLHLRHSQLQHDLPLTECSLHPVE